MQVMEADKDLVNICQTKNGRLLRRALVGGALLLSGCSHNAEQREAAHMLKGKDYFSRKQYREALIEFKVASQNMPRDAEPVYQIGMTYLLAGGMRQAIDAFQKAVALNPKHQGAQYQMAVFEAGSSKPETIVESEKVLTPYVKTHPDEPEAAGALALVDAKLGHKDEALRLLAVAESKNSSNTRPAGLVIAYYAAKGDVATAKEVARGIADRLPNSPDALTLRGQVALATGDTADADAQIKASLALNPKFRPALELRLRREILRNDRAAAEGTTKELAQLSDRQTWADYGRILFAEKKIDEGIAEFNRVLKEHPDDVALRNTFSGLLIDAHRNKEAEVVASETLRKNPKDGLALIQRVSLEIDRGDLNGATKDVKALQEQKAFSSALSYQESRIAGARGETLHEGDLLTESLKRDPRMLAARLELARLLIAAGKPRDAVTILDQANAREKNTAEHAFYRNAATMALGQWDEARKSVDAALKKRRAPGFLYQDAVLRMHAKDVPGARKSLEEAFAISPADPLVIGMLAQVMRQQGDGKKFIALLKDATVKNPGVPMLQNALGAQLAGVGDTQGAQAAFEAAKAAGDTVNADRDLALLDMQAGSLDAARQRLLDEVKLHDNARARLMLADIETRKGSSPDAVIQQYLKALDLEPANVLAMNNLAEILANRQNKLDDGLFWAQKALALAPASPVVQDTVGWILYRQGKYDQAVQLIEKSVRTGDRPAAHYHMAALLMKAGDGTRAKKEYELAVKQDPKSDARKMVGPMFDGNK